MGELELYEDIDIDRVRGIEIVLSDHSFWMLVVVGASRPSPHPLIPSSHPSLPHPLPSSPTQHPNAHSMIDLSLVRINKLVRLLTYPFPWRVIHVAGTNGKVRSCPGLIIQRLPSTLYFSSQHNFRSPYSQKP